MSVVQYSDDIKTYSAKVCLVFVVVVEPLSVQHVVHGGAVLISAGAGKNYSQLLRRQSVFTLRKSSDNT